MMLSLGFGHNQAPRRLLALGAHPDDIEIGAGGTILRLLESNPCVEVQWVVFAAGGPRVAEAESSAEAFLERARQPKIIVQQFPDGFLPYHGQEVKQVFEAIKSSYTPDLILTHFRNDLHQDHRLISELTWNTFRNQLILEYEIPKYDGDFGSPNVFVPLTQEACQQKVDILMRCFSSQRCKPWFTEDLFFSLMRIRGMEAASGSKYSEAFYGRKVVL